MVMLCHKIDRWSNTIQINRIFICPSNNEISFDFQRPNKTKKKRKNMQTSIKKTENKYAIASLKSMFSHCVGLSFRCARTLSVDGFVLIFLLLVSIVIVWQLFLLCNCPHKTNGLFTPLCVRWLTNRILVMAFWQRKGREGGDWRRHLNIQNNSPHISVADKNAISQCELSYSDTISFFLFFFYIHVSFRLAKFHTIAICGHHPKDTKYKLRHFNHFEYGHEHWRIQMPCNRIKIYVTIGRHG